MPRRKQPSGDPTHRKVGDAKTKARAPQAGTLTLDEFRKAISEPLVKWEQGKGLYPSKQEALERRRQAIKAGDLLALHTALQRCYQPTRKGYALEDARLNPELDPEETVCEIPAWLLSEVCSLVSSGLQGKWPKGRGRHAHAIRRQLEAWRDLVCAWMVLVARERESIPWEDVFSHVSESLEGAGTPRTVREAYYRVVSNLREDPDYYRQSGPISIELLEAAGALPKLSD